MLEEYSQLLDDFPNGRDQLVGREWIINAIDCGPIEVVRWMLSKNVCVRVESSEGFPVLHSALDRDLPGKCEILQMLIEAGADINERGMNDYTPAHRAAVRGDIESLKILWRAGADFTLATRIDSYANPLGEVLALGGREEVVVYLKELGL